MIHWGDKRVLVVAPHTDDEIACAGLMHAIEADGGRCTLVALSCCAERLPDGYSANDIKDEWRKSCSRLNAAGVLYDYPVGRLREFEGEIAGRLAKQRTKHEIVICPQVYDPHRDHRTIWAVCNDVFRTHTVLGWEPLAQAGIVRTQYHCELDETDIDAKVDVWRIYESQHHRKDMSEERIRGHAQALGQLARVQSGLAEAYEVVRLR